MTGVVATASVIVVIAVEVMTRLLPSVVTVILMMFYRHSCCKQYKDSYCQHFSHHCDSHYCRHRYF